MSDFDIAITSITVPTDVATGSPLSIGVNVTADADAFDEGVAYRLLVYVFGFQAGPGGTPGLLGGAPLIKDGTLQAPPWNPAAATIPFAPVAGPNPDHYTVTADLFIGPAHTIFQSTGSAPNSVAVHP